MFEQMFSLMDELGYFDEGHVGTDGGIHGLGIGDEKGGVGWEVGGIEEFF